MTTVRIDLHAHSTASDGTESPAVVMAQAAAAGLDVIALTDHDTTAGWVPAAAAARAHGVTLVPGAEVSCRAEGTSVHLLSYLHDPAEPALAAELERTRTDRLERARQMVRLISADYPLTWAEVEARVAPGAPVGRPHIADAMVAKGLVAGRDEAFADVLHSGSRYHVPHGAPGAADALRLILAAGGVPVLAHPRAGRRGRTLSDGALSELAGAGLTGLEVDHRDHAPADRAHLRGLAAELGLFVTGSSDYHGAGKPNRLGENLTAPVVLEQLQALATGTAAVRP